jgi:pseudouridine synthase
MASLPCRLSKLLSDAGLGSRRDMKLAHSAGRVTVEGDPRYPFDHLVAPELNTVMFDGRPVRRREPIVYLLLNKPAGVLTAMSDPHGRDHVGDLVPEGVFPVGRLDRATTGALIFTDDGDLSTLLTHPKHQVWKRYHLTVAETSVDDEDIEALSNGIALDDGMALPARVARLPRGAGVGTRVLVEIREGRKHIVRRMAKRLGWSLLHLERAAIGPVLLGDLACGRTRPLSIEEVEGLYAAAGGREVPMRAARAALTRRLDEGRLTELERRLVQSHCSVGHTE